MTDDETRDAYRLKEVERGVKSIRDELKGMHARVEQVEDWKRAAAERDEKRDRKAERAQNAVITLSVSIVSGIAIALLASGHL